MAGSLAMDDRHAFDRISEADFDPILSQYPETVPSKLAELEEQRLSIIPAVLSKRKKEGNAFLTKAEVATLVDWKLSHGTFRPSLKGLVQQNSEDFVQETTTAGFSADHWNDGLTILSKLKGIGPATAALLLSTKDPKTLPFFSDELFRWAFWENKTGARWDRKIKYSPKEYRELKAKVDELRGRIGRDAIEAEKVAYVLGKREVDLADQVKQNADSNAEEPDKQAATHKMSPPQKSKRKATHGASTNGEAYFNQTAKKQRTPAPASSQRVTRSHGKSSDNAA